MNLVALLIPIILVTQPAGPKFSAKLYPDHESISPGGQVELVVELTVEKGWHIYHPVLLDTGAPTTIDFELSPGATVGDLRFPMPKLGKEADLEYLALEGKVVVLTTLSLAADAPPTPVTVKANVYALACKELCLPVDAEARLTLPVSNAEGVAANSELFEKARAAQSRRLAETPLLTGSHTLISHSQVPIKGRGEVVVALHIAPGAALVGPDPGATAVTGARLLIEKRDGVLFDAAQQTWSAAVSRDVKGIGAVRALTGDVVIRVPFVVDDAKFKPGTVKLGLLLRYQAIGTDGQVQPITMATDAVEFEVVPAGRPAVTNNDPMLASLPAPASGSLPPANGPLPATPLVFLYAFLGGAILNVMPCVLPVIALKIFGFVRQAGEQRRRIFMMGLTYALGILVSFACVGLLIISLKLAWGGLMQRPDFLMGLAAVVFAFALSLLGVYEIQLPGKATDVASAAASREGYAGAFFNGVMTTLLATPCVGPFLGSAIGVLAQLPSPVAFAGIMVVGVGLATPYVLLTAFPAWLRFIPRPGTWMVVFKQAIGFVLVLVVLWLLSLLLGKVSNELFAGTLGLLCAVGIGCWILGKITLSDSLRRWALLWLLALGCVGGGGWASFRVFRADATPIPWQKWQPGLPEKLAADGYTVYIDFWAKWCLTCQTNKRFSLESDRVAREFERLGVWPILADFSDYSPQVMDDIRRYHGYGVPWNVILPAGKPDQPIVLPELLTPGTVVENLSQAGKSRQTPPIWSNTQ
jgi:thiol:disulfide interchange protein